jgi:hypothetical protein
MHTVFANYSAIKLHLSAPVIIENVKKPVSTQQSAIPLGKIAFGDGDANR